MPLRRRRGGSWGVGQSQTFQSLELSSSRDLELSLSLSRDSLSLPLGTAAHDKALADLLEIALRKLQIRALPSMQVFRHLAPDFTSFHNNSTRERYLSGNDGKCMQLLSMIRVSSNSFYVVSYSTRLRKYDLRQEAHIIDSGTPLRSPSIDLLVS